MIEYTISQRHMTKLRACMHLGDLRKTGVSWTADNGAGGLILYYGDDPDEPKKTITITLTMYKDKPKLTCVGEGPLSGKVFSM